MTDDEWGSAHARSLGTYLAGTGLSDVGRLGRPLNDDDFLILFNADDGDLAFTMPAIPGDAWRPVLDTFDDDERAPARSFDVGDVYPLRARSLALLARSAAS
jgi:isoamylase